MQKKKKKKDTALTQTMKTLKLSQIWLPWLSHRQTETAAKRAEDSDSEGQQGHSQEGQGRVAADQGYDHPHPRIPVSVDCVRT